MKEHFKPVLIGVIAVILGLIVYNMFIVGHFGMFESSNYETDDNGEIYKNGMRIAV